MRNIAKMMAVTAATKGKDRRDYDRTEMAMPYMGGAYEMYDRFRDRRGREHYDNGRYAPRGNWDEGMMANYPRGEMDDLESRRYRRDSRGRFRSEMDDEDNVDMHYPGLYPFPPPVYEAGERNPDWDYTHRNTGSPRQERPRMNRIGFDANSSRELNHDYREDASYNPRNEMEPRSGEMRMGGASGHSTKLDKETAEKWMSDLENEDGTKGPHWPMEQTKQVMTKRGFDCDPIEWWVAMNAMYSDYAKVAKKHNVNNIDFYADLAKAWLSDPDSVDGKAAAYYHFIVK